ncbi:MAG: YARHG domain-containing protein [Prevotella sp.]|nr:YARHG domain-containing protein [Bacteroides sp.]MCM1366039.1 YARHG domain-containing protein [Prevotella sp.]MCM1436891.1 YARHG domain-containing protein [Prevotella sp.]
MYCNNCGTDNTPGASFCSNCGTPLQAVPKQDFHYHPVQKSRNNTMVAIGLGLAIVIVGLLVWLIVAMANKPKTVERANDDDDDIEIVDSGSQSGSNLAPSQSTPGGYNYTSGNIQEIANMDFSQSYVSEKWLAGLSKQERRVARNAIYARHGRYFRSKDLQQIFGDCSWYNPYRSEIPQSELNRYEKANIKTIQSWE